MEYESYLDPCEKGFNVALLSDAGCPGIANPGSRIISIAYKKN